MNARSLLFPKYLKRKKDRKEGRKEGRKEIFIVLLINSLQLA
jgi:hypothetical protein